MILVHGLLGSCANMGELARGLSRRFEVLTVDLRNHGRSFHASDMTYPVMAKDLAGFMDDIKLDSAGVVGHSMGGKCAMQLAMDFPDRTAGLVVLDMAPKAYEPIWKGFVQTMLDLDLTSVTHRNQADRLLAQTVPDQAFRGFLLQNLKRSDTGRFVWRANLSAILTAMPDISAPISGRPYPGPALFMRGGASEFVADSDWEDIQILFPEAKLKTIARAGHLIHLEHPDLITGLLTDFFVKIF
ncbi:MAG: alpha/beta fold hydrolase [Desulfotignum sp.]|nr:alpha/beta fold hydrolase [Desulfotignum sp.]